MPSIAITGGIATGKSAATHFLAAKMEASVFSADQEVSQLLDYDPIVAQEIMSVFGSGIYNSQKKVDRVCLRARLIEDPKNKKKLEEILHPRLRKQWLPQAEAARKNFHPLFLAEIPLLYENHLAEYFDLVILIGASAQTQRQRLITHRHFSSQTATAFIQLQLPLLEKTKCAHHVVWNDGSLSFFQEQLKLIIPFVTQLQNSFLLQP